MPDVLTEAASAPPVVNVDIMHFVSARTAHRALTHDLNVRAERI